MRIRKAKYTPKVSVLTCPYCGFEKPESYGQMPEQEDIVSFKTNKKGETIYTCGACGKDFLK